MMTAVNGPSPSPLNSTMWECVSKTTDDLGDTFRFRFKKEEFPDASAIARQFFRNFPATEPIPDVDEARLPNPKAPRVGRVSAALITMGYSYETKDGETYIDLPSKGRIEKVWKTFVLADSSAPFRIVESDGVATDQAFVEAHQDCDALLSNGKEFVHDHYFHVIPAIARVINAGLHRESLQTVFQERIRRQSCALWWLNRPADEVFKDMQGQVEQPLFDFLKENEWWGDYVMALTKCVAYRVDVSTAVLTYEKSTKLASSNTFDFIRTEIGKEAGFRAFWLRHFKEVPTAEELEALKMIWVAALRMSPVARLQEKNSAMWECLAFENDVYRFRFKREEMGQADVYRKQTLLIYPAVEPDNELEELEANIPAREYIGKDRVFRTLRAMGYSWYAAQNETYLCLLTKEKVQRVWMQTYPSSGPFNILEADGIASDWDFLQAYKDSNVHALLSKGFEFVHDHCFHVVPAVTRAIRAGPRREDFDDRVKALIGSRVEVLEVLRRRAEAGEVSQDLLDKIGTIVAYHVDVASSCPEISRCQQTIQDGTIESFIDELDRIEDTKVFWVRRYGQVPSEQEKADMLRLWNEASASVVQPQLTDPVGFNAEREPCSFPFLKP
ncbi:MAG: hypothetical protein KDK78_08185 [Chlamydiia bacterium]|nr:hypothetical protein [Chlamydiia bacterium]